MIEKSLSRNKDFNIKLIKENLNLILVKLYDRYLMYYNRDAWRFTPVIYRVRIYAC